MSKQETIHHKNSEARLSQISRKPPLFGDNVITCNKTDADGNVINVSPISSAIAHSDFDASHK